MQDKGIRRGNSKIKKGVNYKHGGMALELVAESEIEYAILVQIFEHGEMSRGNGSTIAPSGGSTGFYLQGEKRLCAKGEVMKLFRRVYTNLKSGV